MGASLLALATSIYYMNRRYMNETFHYGLVYRVISTSGVYMCKLSNVIKAAFSQLEKNGPFQTTRLFAYQTLPIVGRQ